MWRRKWKPTPVFMFSDPMESGGPPWGPWSCKELEKSKRTLIHGEIYHVHGWEDQYSENECNTQSNLQIQCNPYQVTNGIFHRARTNNFIICMEIQNTSNSQSKFEKEESNWRNQPA